jgi:lysophospholipase L1-like esterase
MKPGGQMRAFVLPALLSCCASVAHADTLFVAGAVPVSSGDQAAITRLEALGEIVTVVKDSSATSASANGKDLVVISDSVAPAKVGTKFTQSQVPVLVYEQRVYDDLGMTGPVAGTDYGVSGLQTQIRMSGTHALTAGLTGVVTIENSPAKFSWGKPGAAAVVAATLKGNSTRAVIFAYEAGDTLASGAVAPARRVALYLNAGAADAWNVNGTRLFDTAAQWALDGSSTPPNEVVRILPLGDSITRGKNGVTSGRWSYRRDLEAALVNAGCSFDFVGSQNSPDPGPSSGTPLVDRDNEGHSGLRTDEVKNRLKNWLPGNDHDWALIHLGTNDVLQGTGISAARSNLGNIIDQLRAKNSHVGILIAQIIPNFPENTSAVVALNDEIVSLAAEKNTAASPVIAVDQYSGYNASSYNIDGIHPNETGEAVIALRWADALTPRISNYCSN